MTFRNIGFDEGYYFNSPRFFHSSLTIGGVSIHPPDLYSVFDSFLGGEQVGISEAEMKDIVEGLSILASEGRHRVEEVLSSTVEHEEGLAWIQAFRSTCGKLIDAVNAQLNMEKLDLSHLTFDSLSTLCLHYGRWASSCEQANGGAEILLNSFLVRLNALVDGDVKGLIEMTRAIGMRQLIPLIRRFNQEALGPGGSLAELKSQLFRLTSQEANVPEDLIDILGQVQAQHLLNVNQELARREYETFADTVDQTQVEFLKGARIQVERVAEVAKDERWFRVDGLDTPVRLSRALVHQFYSLVGKKKWWEALDLIPLSQRGDYRIAHKRTKDNLLKLSVAIRIQGVKEKNPEDNLYLSPPFTHSDWSVDCFDPKRLAQVIRAISQEGFSHLTEGIDLSKLVKKPTNVQNLMSSLILTLGEFRMVEKSRLTREVDISQEDYASGLIQIGDQLAGEGILAGIVMTETPYLNMFENLGFLIGRPCIVPVASCKMRPQDKYKTHQVLFFYPNKNLLKNFLAFAQKIAEVEQKPFKTKVVAYTPPKP